MTTRFQQPFQGSTPVVEDGLRPSDLAHETGNGESAVIETAHGTFATCCSCAFFYEVVEGDYRCPWAGVLARYQQSLLALNASMLDELERLRGQERRDRDEWATASQLGARA